MVSNISIPCTRAKRHPIAANHPIPESFRPLSLFFFEGGIIRPVCGILTICNDSVTGEGGRKGEHWSREIEN